MTQLIANDDRLLYDNPEWYGRMFPDPDFDVARFVDRLIGRFGGGRRVLDAGCGYGRDVGYLTSLGYDVVGLDAHPVMLEHALASLPRGRFVLGRMEEMDLGVRFDVLMCMGSALLQCWSNEALLMTFRNFRRHLEDGGLLILDVRNGAYFIGNGEAAAWLAAEHSSEIEVEGGRLQATARYRIAHEAQLLERVREWRLPGREEPLLEQAAWRLLFPQELRFFLTQAGFEVLATFDGPGPYENGWDRDPRWEAESLPTTLSGRRLHAVARAHPTTG